MKFQLQDVPKEKLDSIRERVESNSGQIDEIVKDIIQPYCKNLDKYVAFIHECLLDVQKQPSPPELEDWCLNLSTEIYFASGMSELLGIRDDIAKAVYKEVYNTSRNALDKGTVADKDSIAALQSQAEAIISSAYTRAYRTMKDKMDAAQEILQSCKKVLQNRISERELTHIQGQ